MAGFEPRPHWWEASALTTTPPLPPPLPPLLTNIIEKKGYYQKCNSNVFAVSRHFYPLGNYPWGHNVFRVKMIGPIFMLLVSLKWLQGCLHCVQHCATDKTSSRFFFPWAIYRLVTANVNLKRQTQVTRLKLFSKG